MLKLVHYDVKPGTGRRYAKSCVVIVPDSNCDSIMTGLHEKEIVALVKDVTYTIHHPFSGKVVTFHRQQLLILPAFAMTDYKAQGRTILYVILDLESARGIQLAYVMLSCATSLDQVLILRRFEFAKIKSHMSKDLREEYA